MFSKGLGVRYRVRDGESGENLKSGRDYRKRVHADDIGDIITAINHAD